MYGSVAERSKALVLGTSLFGGVGSNPTAATGFEGKLVRVNLGYQKLLGGGVEGGLGYRRTWGFDRASTRRSTY